MEIPSKYSIRKNFMYKILIIPLKKNSLQIYVNLYLDVLIFLENTFK